MNATIRPIAAVCSYAVLQLFVCGCALPPLSSNQDFAGTSTAVVEKPNSADKPPAENAIVRLPPVEESDLLASTKGPASGHSAGEIRQVALFEPASPEQLPPTTAAPRSAHHGEVVVRRPAYALEETFPIDLPTVIRLVDENNPGIAFAQARLREAAARQRTAELQWVPNLSVGSIYNRFDGQTQNQRGEVFGVSRANLLGGGQASLSLDFAQAVYAPLIARRVSAAESMRTSATVLGSELEAVLGYLDLVQLYAQLEVNADTTVKAEAMLQAASNAQEAKLDRSPGDVNRARAEVLIRRQERLDLLGRAGGVSARLGKLLLLSPHVKLVPADQAVVPVTLISPETTLDDLVAVAIENRPDLAANREFLSAAWAAVRRANHGPLLPKLVIQDQGGVFGGGVNDNLSNFDGRNVIGAQLFWELKNLGFGNRAESQERAAQADQAQSQLIETQARITAEVVEAAQIAAAKYESLALAEQAVKEAEELYRINREGTFNVVDAKNLFDALRPLQSIQILNQARNAYLAAVSDFNRAQYRLYALLGNPPKLATEADCLPVIP